MRGIKCAAYDIQPLRLGFTAWVPAYGLIGVAPTYLFGSRPTGRLSQAAILLYDGWPDRVFGRAHSRLAKLVDGPHEIVVSPSASIVLFAERGRP
jgi:hypothetical protein